MWKRARRDYKMGQGICCELCLLKTTGDLKQCDYLNKIQARTIPIDMLVWRGEKNYKQILIAKKGRVSISQG